MNKKLIFGIIGVIVLVLLGSVGYGFWSMASLERWAMPDRASWKVI